MFHRLLNYGELGGRQYIVLTKAWIRANMPKYRRHDDLIIIQEEAWEKFKEVVPIKVVENENSPFSVDEDELASLVCQSITQMPTCRRLAIERRNKGDDYRTPNVRLILGDTGLVDHKDNHIIYRFDVTKCMFSFGNIREKMRMAELSCNDEVVVDLFAGIGYFTLPLLIHAQAKHLYACEWNPDAIEFLKKNLDLNKVEASRCTVIEGDNRQNRPTNVAQRVILGILPSCRDFLKTALECVDQKTGAILHCHDLVEVRPSKQEPDSPSQSRVASEDPADQSNSPSNNTNQANQTDPSGASSSETGDKPRASSDNQSLLNQSLSSSSTSSHSTIEKLSAPSDESRQLHSSDSDKDTSSPVLLEKPTSQANSSFDISTQSTSQDETSEGSSNHEDKCTEPIPTDDPSAYEMRALALIEHMREDLEANDMTATVVHIEPVKSYAPHVNHVVFDIRVEPKKQHDSSTRRQ